jgi:hypothetical protein
MEKLKEYFMKHELNYFLTKRYRHVAIIGLSRTFTESTFQYEVVAVSLKNVMGSEIQFLRMKSSEEHLKGTANL